MVSYVTGRILEEEIFCELDVSWNGYMTYNKAMSFVRDHQNWNPTDPTTSAGGDLHAEVALAIENRIGREIDWTELGMYSALHTPLDFFHGVDGFFVFRGSIVTVDVTKNPNKDHYKADLILQYSDFSREDRDRYDFSLVADRIAEMLICPVTMGANA